MKTEYPSNSGSGWANEIREKRNRHRDQHGIPFRRWQFIWTIIWNLIFLYIVNKVPHWNLEFINSRYMVVLWVLNANILVHIGACLLAILLGTQWGVFAGKILMGAASFIMNIVLYYLNPFDFSMVHGWTWLDRFLPILFIIGMVVSALSVLVNAWKLIFRS